MNLCYPEDVEMYKRSGNLQSDFQTESSVDKIMNSHIVSDTMRAHYITYCISSLMLTFNTQEHITALSTLWHIKTTEHPTEYILPTHTYNMAYICYIYDMRHNTVYRTWHLHKDANKFTLFIYSLHRTTCIITMKCLHV